MDGNDTERNARPSLLFFGGYDPDYPRNQVIRKGWGKLGFELEECRVDFRRKVHTRYPALIWKYLRRHIKSPVIFVPDFRHKDIPLAWLLSKFSGSRLVFDPLVSRYETRVLDRADVRASSAQAWHNRNIDTISFQLADILLVDTDVHGRFYIENFGVSREKVFTLPVGYDEDIFGEAEPKERGDVFDVLFFGSFLPHHGVETIVRTAWILRDENFRFTFIGRGQTYESVRAYAAGIPGERLRFIEHVPYRELPSFIERADIVLGIFGKTVKAGLVVPNKVFQSMAMARCVVTAQSKAVSEFFQSGEHVFTVPAGNADKLAEALRLLEANDEMRQRIASNGAKLVRTLYNSRRIARRLLDILNDRGCFESASRK
ncbi:hypothetical protein DRQ05_06490 [bacterium]|nr:MAG: hypothetical protein DRQ05_06490 [bacterium]